MGCVRWRLVPGHGGQKGPRLARALPLSCQNPRRRPQHREGVSGEAERGAEAVSSGLRARKRPERRSAMGGIRALSA